MSRELFQEYKGFNARDGVVAAAVVSKENIKSLSLITGGTAVAKKVRGGSMVMCEILLHGKSAKIGDYIVADHQKAFLVFPKDFFERLYKKKGLLRDPDPSTERR